MATISDVRAYRERQQRGQRPQKAPVPLEHAEQAALVKWYRAQYPYHAWALAAWPNGGWRNKITAAMLKAEGVQPGMPDLFLSIPVAPYHGLYIEMKRRGGKGRVTEPQRVMQKKLAEVGYCVRVCRGFDEAKAAIERYFPRHAQPRSILGPNPWNGWTGD